MPKSKQRKFQSRPAQQRPLAASAAGSTPVSSPAVAPTATVRKTGQSAIKTAPIEQLRYISNELKVIAILTVVIIAAIIVLYFVFK